MFYKAVPTQAVINPLSLPFFLLYVRHSSPSSLYVTLLLHFPRGRSDWSSPYCSLTLWFHYALDMCFINNQEIDDHLLATAIKFRSFCAQMNRWRGLQYRHHQEFSFKCAGGGREGEACIETTPLARAQALLTSRQQNSRVDEVDLLTQHAI